MLFLQYNFNYKLPDSLSFLYFSPSAFGTEHAETLEMDDSEGKTIRLA